MPFLNQAGVDWLLMNANPDYPGDIGQDYVLLSLHTEDTASAANELTALSAPGYARAVGEWRGATGTPPRIILRGDTSVSDRPIRFGPATATWPTVRSIGVWVSNGANAGAGLLAAYITLTSAQRFTLGNHFTYDITADGLYFSLPDRTDDGLGWHGGITFFDDILRINRDYTGATGQYSGDVGGSAEGESASGAPGDDVLCALNIYPSNPLATAGNLSAPLRTINQLSPRPYTGYGGFYYSPGLHALTNFLQLRTGGGASGTATHWVVARTTDPTQVVRGNVLFLGEFSPGVALTNNQTMFFDRRAVRCPMTFGG